MKYKIIIVSLMLLGFILAYFWNFSIYGNVLGKVSIKGVGFRAEMVTSPYKRELGLGGRKNLCPNCTMLFVFPAAGSHGFWMKDMNFDLDIIWIRENKITKIARNVSKNNQDLIIPEEAADKVLEINSGLSDKYGFKVGDKVEIK